MAVPPEFAVEFAQIGANSDLTAKQSLKKTYEGIDPEQARQLELSKRELEEKAALKAGELHKVVAGRVRSIKSGLERTIAERDTLNSRLADIQINQGVIVAATKCGLLLRGRLKLSLDPSGAGG